MENRRGIVPNCKTGGLIYSVGILIYIAVSFLGQLLLTSFGANEVVYYAVGSLFSVISLFSVTFFFSIRSEARFKDISGFKKFKPEYIFIAVLLSFGMFGGLGFVNTLVGDFLVSIGLKVSTTAIPLNGVFEYVLFSVTVCVLPAVVEEVFFRGLLSSSLGNKGRISKALTIGLFFSLYHTSFSQLVYQFVYGVFLSLLADRAKSVVPSILSHFINNFAVLTFYFFDVSIDFFNPFLICSGLLCLFVAAFFLLYKNKSEKSEDNKLEFAYLYGSAGLAACAFLIIAGAII